MVTPFFLTREAKSGLSHAERQTVAGGEPGEGDDGGHAERLGDGGDDVLAPHHAAIEERETRQGHQQHQGRRGEDPGARGTVDLGDSLVRQQGRCLSSRFGDHLGREGSLGRCSIGRRLGHGRHHGLLRKGTPYPEQGEGQKTERKCAR
jgi:hypothetical protein